MKKRKPIGVKPKKRKPIGVKPKKRVPIGVKSEKAPIGNGELLEVKKFEDTIYITCLNHKSHMQVPLQICQRHSAIKADLYADCYGCTLWRRELRHRGIDSREKIV